MVDINLTRDASAHLCIAEAVELRDQDRLRLEERSTLLDTFFRRARGSETPYLDKVSCVPIVVDAARVEARPGALCAQAGN